MTNLPSMILFINGDITYPQAPPIFIGAQPNNPQSDASVSELTNLQIQLFIDDTMTKAEFDARVAADINYPTIIHLQNLRVMVILPLNVPFCQETINFQYADIVVFLHQGLADVEHNRLGPPCHNFPVQRLTIYELLRSVGSHNVVILPWGVGGGECCETCHSGFFCDICHTFSGIRKCFKCGCSCKCRCDVGLIDNQGIRQSPIHLRNCDNEANNHAFIHRK